MEIESLLTFVLKIAEAAKTCKSAHISDELLWDFIHPTWDML